MKLFSSIIAMIFPVCSLMAMPCPDFQDVGTTNLSFCSSGDLSATVGVFNEKNIKSEVEFDYNVKNDRSFGVAGKIGFDECVFDKNSPSFAVGIFGGGIRSKHEVLSANNILYAITSKSYSKGRIQAGVFHGNRTMGEERQGCFAGYTQHLIIEQIDETHKRSKLDLYGEYVTGKSNLSGAKVELKYLINEKMNIKFGPAWEFQKETQDSSKWAMDKIKWLLSFSVNI